MLSKQVPLGIYEKALPAGSAGWNGYSWRKLGFDFVEMSVDETDERLLASTGAASSVWRW
jgi:L-ribulose-5-phosphate 3-epimerase